MKNTYLELEAETFRAQFPRRPFLVKHRLADHPLFAISRLLELAKALPESCVEYNEGNIPVNMGYKASPRTGLSAEETIRRIKEAHSWMVLKYVEKDAEYQALLHQCLDEIEEYTAPVVGKSFNREGFIFLSSPNSTTPFHVDPEHNFLLQIQGQKSVSQFDPTDPLVLNEADIERGLFGKNRNLNFNEEIQARGRVFDLTPGVGLHFPVAAPHWVKNGPDVSISFSITFGSRESEKSLAVRHFNAGLRERGIDPTPYGRSTSGDNAKFFVYRGARRLRRLIGLT